MQKVTILIAFAFLTVSPAFGQQAETDFVLTFPVSDQLEDPYNTIHPNGNWGARGVSGPHDLDGDGSVEVLLTDYTGGGRVHVVEHQGGENWQKVYSTPALDSVSTNRNARYATGGDLDGDGNGEILFLAGWLYGEDDPYGLYVYEYTGSGNDYGSEPTFIFDFTVLESPPDPIRSEIMHAEDIDGDTVQELVFANNGSATGDDWFVLSITGDIGSGFANVNVELRLSSGNTSYDPVDRGGGSPYGIEIANLDGEGMTELSLNSWNSFNFTNAGVTAADIYETPGQDDDNVFYQATDELGVDDLAFYSGAVADVNQDGDDEVFYPREFSTIQQAVSVLNYENGEDVLQVTPDNVALDVISGDSLDGLTHWGLTAGNLDSDAAPELIGTGWNYFPHEFEAGEPSHFLHVADFVGGQGGDPEDPANYEITKIETPHPLDSLAFHIVHRDSAGTQTTYRELRERNGTDYDDSLIPSKLAYLGDVDDDGAPEVATSFRNTFDTLFVYNETWNADSMEYEREIAEQIAVDHPVLRIFTLDETILPVAELPDGKSGFALSTNHPNPVRSATRFSYRLPRADVVSVKVYDVLGRVVATLAEKARRPAGTHRLDWDGTNQSGQRLASGVYFYTLEHSTGRLTRKMVLVR